MVPSWGCVESDVVTKPSTGQLCFGLRKVFKNSKTLRKQTALAQPERTRNFNNQPQTVAKLRGFENPDFPVIKSFKSGGNPPGFVAELQIRTQVWTMSSQTDNYS